MTSTRPAGSHRQGSTSSSDGARIGFRSLGDGPGVVILHGAMQSGASQSELGALLAAELTVHLVDRRGRGLSDDYPAAFSTAVEVADLLAVLAATGATTVLGVSSGALIALRAALASPGVERLVLFEPPLRRAAVPAEDLARYARDKGDLVAGMVTAMRLAEMGPGLMRALPGPVLRAATRRMLASDDKRALVDGRVHSRVLAENLGYEIAIASEQAGRLGDFAAVTSSTLLISGTKSRPYLRTAVADLAATVPGARLVELVGQNHGVTQNKKDWGRPHLVAPPVLEFLRAGS